MGLRAAQRVCGWTFACSPAHSRSGEGQGQLSNLGCCAPRGLCAGAQQPGTGASLGHYLLGSPVLEQERVRVSIGGGPDGTGRAGRALSMGDPGTPPPGTQGQVTPLGMRVLGVECLPFDLPVAPLWSELGPQAHAGTQSPQTCPRMAVEPGQPQAGVGTARSHREFQDSERPGHQAVLRTEQPPRPTCSGALSPLLRWRRHTPGSAGSRLVAMAVYEAPLSGNRTPRLSTACTHGRSSPCRDSGSLALRQTLPQAGHRAWLGLCAGLRASLAHPAGPAGCWVNSPKSAVERLGCWVGDEARTRCVGGQRSFANVVGLHLG